MSLNDVEPTAFFIHGAMHRSKPSAKCVMRTHMPFATTLTVLHGGRLERAGQNSLKFHGRVAMMTGKQMMEDSKQAELHFAAIRRMLDRE